jgi:predicted Zn-dependent peptidase
MRPLSRILTIFAILALAAGAVFAQVKMSEMKYRDRTLPNGLRLLSVLDKSSPTVTINVWYHVGSKDDPDHRSGFAHLFEHIMFKSTKNMKAEMMDRLTEDVGGNNNATTQDDATIYYETIPSNYLETLLWAEAERLASLTMYGVPLDEINHYVAAVEAIKPADVKNFAASRLNADSTSVVIVGDAKQFLPDLQKQFPNVEVIPAADLDLNSASLKKTVSRN